MKTGNRVKMSPMWKYDLTIGTIIKITKHHVIVKWDDINGDWHYTEEQAKRIEVIDDDR